MSVGVGVSVHSLSQKLTVIGKYKVDARVIGDSHAGGGVC